MQTKPTQARVRPIAGGAIIDLEGDINSQGEKTLRQAYQKACQAVAEADTPPPPILLNFAQADYINTSGIAVLISIVMEAQKADQKVILFGMSSHYQKIFKLVRLPLYADMYPTEKEALAALT